MSKSCENFKKNNTKNTIQILTINFYFFLFFFFVILDFILFCNFAKNEQQINKEQFNSIKNKKSEN